MIRSRGRSVALSALVVGSTLLLGCGGGGSTSAGERPETAAGGVRVEETPAAGRQAAVVRTMATPDPARVVVDSDGMTVYEFRRDNPMLYQFDRDPVPTCYGACSATWLPLLTDDPPRAAGGAQASMLGTIRRRDGGVQVTYAGHPLYLFSGDRWPGEMNGQEADSFGAEWHAVEGDGQELVASP